MADLTNLGKRAEGKISEWLDNRREEGLCFYRIKDQMTGFVGSTNPCDFFLFRKPHFYPIESKATYEDRFDFAMITKDQHDSMIKMADVDGVTCYIAVLFASYKQMYLIDIKDIERMELQGKKSLNIKKIDKWPIPYIRVRTLESRKELLDYDPDHALEIF